MLASPPAPQQASSGRYRRAGSPIKLPGKSSQTQANHTQADQPAKIRDEPNDREDQQAHQEPQQPIALRSSRGLQKYPPQEGSNPNLRQVDRSQIYREQH